ncbi:hypothetical protein ACHWQZ_G004689 [Mnemiopsis leidyi]
MSESTKLGMLPVTTVLSALGTIANLTSLIYFIKKGKKSIGDKLLMLLNCIDLVVCFMATIITFMILIRTDNGISVDVFFMLIIYLLVVDGTSYVTCLLSVTRAIGIASPFYKIRGKLLVIAGIGTFIVMEIASHLIPMFIESGNGVIPDILRGRMVMTSIIILLGLCATLVTAYKLTRKEIPEGTEGAARNNKKATWTVVILSTLFFIFNSIVIFLSALASQETEGSDTITKSPGAVELLYAGIFLAIPLNSTLNPVVYLAVTSSFSSQKSRDHIQQDSSTLTETLVQGDVLQTVIVG